VNARVAGVLIVAVAVADNVHDHDNGTELLRCCRGG
jgi:hypothetical protein